MQACIHDAHSTRSSHALRDHMEAFCGRVLAARRIVTLLRTTFDVLVPRVPAEATRRLRMRSVLPTSHGRGFAGLMRHGPLGHFAVALVV